jgi:hypothetical protein
VRPGRALGHEQLIGADHVYDGVDQGEMGKKGLTALIKARWVKA